MNLPTDLPNETWCDLAGHFAEELKSKILVQMEIPAGKETGHGLRW